MRSTPHMHPSDGRISSHEGECIGGDRDIAPDQVMPMGRLGDEDESGVNAVLKAPLVPHLLLTDRPRHQSAPR